MSLPAFFAKLSLAGKLTVGGSVAFASVAGAGAAGALPGPLQDGYKAAVSAVTDDNTPSLITAGDTTPPTDDATTLPDDPTSVPADPPDTTAPSDTTQPTEPNADPGDGTPPVSDEEPEPTTVPDGDGTHDKGEHRSPETIALSCAFAEPVVHCEWSGESPGGALPDGAKYVLLKTGEGHEGRALFPAPGETSFDDTVVRPHRTVHYMIIVTKPGERRPVAHSNRVEVKLPASGNDKGSRPNQGHDGKGHGGQGHGDHSDKSHGGDGTPELPPTTNDATNDAANNA